MTQHDDSEHKMSLRDAFAKAAMQGMGTWTPPSTSETSVWLWQPDAMKARAEWAYAQADAMLDGRKK